MRPVSRPEVTSLDDLATLVPFGILWDLCNCNATEASPQFDSAIRSRSRCQGDFARGAWRALLGLRETAQPQGLRVSLGC